MEINNELIRSLGISLVHSIWEGLIILILVLFALSLAGRSNARIRYVVLVSGHFLLLVGFISTWYIVYNHNITSAINPLTKIYSQVNGLVSNSSVALRTADYTTTFNQYLEPLYPVLAAGWALGFIIMVFRMAGGFYISYTILKRDLFLPDQAFMDLFEKIKARLVIPVSMKLRMTTRQISPMVIGIIKPIVIVPVSVLSGLSTEQTEAILVHELAHIRRYDHFIMIVQAIITQILFFHPVAWFLSKEIDRERENCCDDFVIKSFPNPINYIKALTMIQELNVEGQVPANALLGRSKHLLGRIKRMLNTEKSHASVLRMAAIFLLLISLGIAAIAFASAANSVNRKSLEEFLTVIPGKTLVFADTSKIKKHEKPAAETESLSKEDTKKQKELTEAVRKLEKAHQELQKAQFELHMARQEFMRAQQMHSQDIAEMLNSQGHPISDEQKQEWYQLDKNLQELLKNKEEHYHLNQEAMRESMHLKHSGQEDWQRHIKEWEFAQPVVPIPPAPPSPDINIPEIPDFENLTPPEPVIPMEIINEEDISPDKENKIELDSKLREVEAE